MRIALVGPYPKPFGGVSVHIKRLADLLANHGHDVMVVQINKEAERVKPIGY